MLNCFGFKEWVEMNDAITRLISLVKDKKFLKECSDIEIDALETQANLILIAVNKEKNKRGI
jgi:hypothetical protein